MSNRFYGRGNLGAAPVLKHIEVDGDTRPVAELRVYFDRPVPNADHAFIDKGGFWLDVNLWGPRAEATAKLLSKGVRVNVTGTLIFDAWDDKESGEPRGKFKVSAEAVDLDLSRVEQFALKSKPAEQSTGAETGH